MKPSSLRIERLLAKVEAAVQLRTYHAVGVEAHRVLALSLFNIGRMVRLATRNVLQVCFCCAVSPPQYIPLPFLFRHPYEPLAVEGGRKDPLQVR
jgi:hypothetical protein